jgi:hypothetical protein
MPVTIASFPLCRDHDLFWPLEQYPALLRRNPADEAYWFKWSSTFSGEATIRVARLGRNVTVTRLHKASMFCKARCRNTRLKSSVWAQVEDAAVGANFWMLDERGGVQGLDGAEWLIAGRRRHDYHLVKRWSPCDGVFDLGRLLFDLAGLEEVGL